MEGCGWPGVNLLGISALMFFGALGAGSLPIFTDMSRRKGNSLVQVLLGVGPIGCAVVGEGGREQGDLVAAAGVWGCCRDSSGECLGGHNS